MTYEELQDVFWSLCNLLVQDEVTAPSDQHIRWKYPETGQPDWKLTDNVLFLFLNERDDDYGKQLDTTWDTRGEHVIRKRSRTRVWELDLTAYGPKSCEIVNRIKDGVFRQDAKELLKRLGKDIPDVYAHVASAMRKNAVHELWPPALSRKEMQKTYFEYMYGKK